MPHLRQKTTVTARQPVADPPLCTAQSALRARAWNVLTGFPKADQDQTGDAPSLTDRLARTVSARVARIVTEFDAWRGRIGSQR